MAVQDVAVISVTDDLDEKEIVIKKIIKGIPLSTLEIAKRLTERISFTRLSSIAFIEGKKAADFSLNGGTKGLKFQFAKIDKLAPASPVGS